MNLICSKIEQLSTFQAKNQAYYLSWRGLLIIENGLGWSRCNSKGN